MTLSNIPDNLYKLLILLGVVIIAYSIFENKKDTDEYQVKKDSYNQLSDSIRIEIKKNKHYKDKLVETADDFSRKYSIKNPITDKDSIISFDRIYIGKKNEVIIGDTLNLLWDEYLERSFFIDLLTDKLNNAKTKLDTAESQYDDNMIQYIIQLVIGGLMFVIGLFGMIYHQRLQDNLLEKQLLEKGTFYKHCQSCGKKFSSILIPGKEVNGDLNKAFCINCYDNGTFNEPNLNIEEVLKRADIHISTIKSKSDKQLFISKIKSLERWKENEYE